jgi:hypothetical protein
MEFASCISKYPFTNELNQVTIRKWDSYRPTGVQVETV